MTIREVKEIDIPALHRIRVTVNENALSNPGLISYDDYSEFLFTRDKGWVVEIDNTIVRFAAKRNARRVLRIEGKVWSGTAPGTRAEKFCRASGWRESGMDGKEIKFEMTKPEWFARR
jgi:hypothetical protein